MASDSDPIVLTCHYLDNLRWYRGNLHTHTTYSDGTRSPEEVIADYEHRGYDFLTISDHDILVDPDDYQNATLMTLIPGVEISANGPHILHVNANGRLTPNEDRQKNLDEIARQPDSFAVLNHPNWLSRPPDLHYSTRLMTHLKGYAGIEIYNGVIERLPGTALATDRWDHLLSMGLRLWGYGHDDSHDTQDVAIVWNVVQAPDQTLEHIVAALREGRFYVSTGIDIQSIRVTGRRISILTSNATRIRFISQWGVIQTTTDSQAAEYTIPDNPVEAGTLGYIRVECHGGDGTMAWTQPIWIKTG